MTATPWPSEHSWQDPRLLGSPAFAGVSWDTSSSRAQTNTTGGFQPHQWCPSFCFLTRRNVATSSANGGLELSGHLPPAPTWSSPSLGACCCSVLSGFSWHSGMLCHCSDVASCVCVGFAKLLSSFLSAETHLPLAPFVLVLETMWFQGESHCGPAVVGWASVKFLHFWVSLSPVQ